MERVIAIGDVHGDYESFAAVLRSAGLIDKDGNWTGGKTHLVQTGDIVDRGPDSRAVMDLLIKLQKQAAAAGGAVHCLLGNHEAMNIYGDLRYVSPAEFAAFAPQNSQADRAAAYPDQRAITAAATPEMDHIAMAARASGGVGRAARGVQRRRVSMANGCAGRTRLSRSTARCLYMRGWARSMRIGASIGSTTKCARNSRISRDCTGESSRTSRVRYGMPV